MTSCDAWLCVFLSVTNRAQDDKSLCLALMPLAFESLRRVALSAAVLLCLCLRWRLSVCVPVAYCFGSWRGCVFVLLRRGDRLSLRGCVSAARVSRAVCECLCVSICVFHLSAWLRLCLWVCLHTSRGSVCASLIRIPSVSAVVFLLSLLTNMFLTLGRARHTHTFEQRSEETGKTHKQKNKQKNKTKHTTHVQTNRPKKKTEKQTDRQTDRQTDKPTINQQHTTCGSTYSTRSAGAKAGFSRARSLSFDVHFFDYTLATLTRMFGCKEGSHLSLALAFNTSARHLLWHLCRLQLRSTGHGHSSKQLTCFGSSSLSLSLSLSCGRSPLIGTGVARHVQVCA